MHPMLITILWTSHLYVCLYIYIHCNFATSPEISILVSIHLSLKYFVGVMLLCENEQVILELAHGCGGSQRQHLNLNDGRKRDVTEWSMTDRTLSCWSSVEAHVHQNEQQQGINLALAWSTIKRALFLLQDFNK